MAPDFVVCVLALALALGVVAVLAAAASVPDAHASKDLPAKRTLDLRQGLLTFRAQVT